MYTAESIAPRKVRINKLTPIIWYICSTIAIFISYPIFTLYSQNHSTLTLFTGVLLPIILVVIIQELIARQQINIFPYWTFILLVGSLLGFVCSLIFIGGILSFVLLTGYTTLQVQGNTGIILTIIAIPSAAGLIFVLMVYIFWHRIVKPIHDSKRLSDKNKLLVEGIVSVLISVFISICAYVAFLILTISNLVVAYFFACFVFSYLTFSGFRDICSENVFFNVFKPKD